MGYIYLVYVNVYMAILYKIVIFIILNKNLINIKKFVLQIKINIIRLLSYFTNHKITLL